jgi:K+-sensing histidine kinase KdpD
VRQTPAVPASLRRNDLVLPAFVGIGAPLALTAVLTHLDTGQSRDYTFLYLAVVAALGLFSGLISSLLAAAVSFLCVDYFFVVPFHTLTISDETDLVNLLVFFGAAGVVGGLSSRRRRAQLQAEALARDLGAANAQLERLNREEADAARTAVRLAQSQQQVRLLEETDRLRRELLQNVSHELRTPLASILTGTTAMLARDDVPAEWRDAAAGIVGEARRLDRLVGDMLDMARIEGGALDLHLEEIEMGEAATAAADRLHRLNPDRVVNVVVDGEPVDVVADWDRVGQMLDNLLVNANRFAPAGTPIEVHVSPGARGSVVTHVVDEGPGVPPAMRERIFERFVGQRGPANGDGQPRLGGTGLGLAIVRGLAEAQAGRVWLDDPMPDQTGARFAFSLPAARTDPG